MNLLSCIFSLFRGDLQRKQSSRTRRTVYETPRTWVKNTSPIPDEPFFEAGGPAVKRHFALVDKIEAAWKAGDRPKILKFCQEQIALSPEVMAALTEEQIINGSPPIYVGHTGFLRLAMLHEKDKNYQNAIIICEQAIAEGWAHDAFTHRAARCHKKLTKRRQNS